MVPPLPSHLHASLLYDVDPVSTGDQLSLPYNYASYGSSVASSLPLASNAATRSLLLPQSSSLGLSSLAALRSPSALEVENQTHSSLGLSSLAALRSPSAIEIENQLLLARVRALNQELVVSSAPTLSSLTLPSAMSSHRAGSVPQGLLPTASARLLALAEQQGKQHHLDALDEEELVAAARTGHRRKPTPDEAWDVMFKALVRYRLRHGNCLVREKDDPKLGRWVRNQRNRKKQGRLTEDRIGRLDSIGFVWCMVHQESWEVMFQRLVDYKKKHGDCLVPRSYKDDPKLGRWVDTQRNKNRDDMSDERMQQLKDLGFVWQVHKQSWDSMYDRLKKFKETHGDCLVPSVYREDPKLGTWVHVQRARRSLLSEERKKRLDDLGFVWCMFSQKRK